MYRAKEQRAQHFSSSPRAERSIARAAARSRRACAARSSAASSCCTTSRRSTSRRGASSASRRWCAGSIPSSGLVAPGRLHPARRGDRPHRADRRMGAAHGVRADAAWQRQGCAPTRRSRSTSRRASSRQTGLVETVAARFDETGLAPACLELEITESLVMHQTPTSAIGMLNELRAIGVQLAIDDFGTGYSSLALPEAPPGRPPEDRPVVRARHHSDAGRRGDRRARSSRSATASASRSSRKAWKPGPSVIGCAPRAASWRRAICSAGPSTRRR